MRSILSFLISFLIVAPSWGQMYDPVKWSFNVDVVNENEVDLVIHADIEEGWYVYSQDAGDGPISTSFAFFDNDKVELIGSVTEGEAIEDYDPNFEATLRFFKSEADFTQRIKLLTQDTTLIKGEFEFMVCNKGMCLPPEWVDIEVVLPAAQVAAEESKGFTSTASEQGIWSIFLIAFLSGFVALLTPCVFPMIPMTVSFFTKQSENKAAGIRNAIIYGLSIIFIYVILGVAVSAIFGADALNNMATNVYFNIAFFLLLVIFAASFLGAFELTMPNSWINKADSASDRGGFNRYFLYGLYLGFSFVLLYRTYCRNLACGGCFWWLVYGPYYRYVRLFTSHCFAFCFFCCLSGLVKLIASVGWLVKFGESGFRFLRAGTCI